MSGGLLDSALRASVLLIPALIFALGSRRSSAAVRHVVCFLGILVALAIPVLSRIIPDLELAVLPAVSSTAGNATTGGSPGWLGPALAGVWLLGATVVFSRVLGGVSRARALCRRATLVSDARVLSAVIRVRRELGLDMPIRVLSQRSLTAPLTWGLLRPIVLLPRGATNWSRGRLRAVLLHELSHARRRDCLTQLVADVACTVYWFHPLVWLVARRMRVERERACDDTVVVVGGRPSGYAVLLLRMVKGIRGGASPARPGAAATFADGGGLAGRLRALLGRVRDRRSLSPAAVTAFALGALTLALPVAAVEFCARTPGPQAPAPATTVMAVQPGSLPTPSRVTRAPTVRPDPRVELPALADARMAPPESPDESQPEPQPEPPEEPPIADVERQLEEILRPLTGRPMTVRRIDPNAPRPPRGFLGFYAGFTFLVQFKKPDDPER